MQKRDEKQIKVCLLGDQAVGKSCLARRYVQDTFNDIEPTVGASYIARLVNLDTGSYKVQIWDTAGQEQYRNLAPMYYRGAAAALLVFDITYEKSFLSVNSWIQELKEMGPEDMLLILVGNKADIAHNRTVSEQEIESYARDHGITYFETSAKTGANVENAFTHVCRHAPERMVRTTIPMGHIQLSDDSDTVKSRKKKRCCN